MAKSRLPADLIAQHRVLAFLLSSVGVPEADIAARVGVNVRTVRGYIRKETDRQVRIAAGDPMIDRAEAAATYDFVMREVLDALPRATAKDKAPLIGQLLAARQGKNKVRGTEAAIRIEQRSLSVQVKLSELSPKRIAEIKNDVLADVARLRSAEPQRSTALVVREEHDGA